MTIAWFRDRPPNTGDPLDDTAALLDELRATHTIDIIVEADAHDFVWRHFLRPWDLCVYELDDTQAHQFEWAYLVNYPGVVLLKSAMVRNSWGDALSREGRLDAYMAGFGLNDSMPAISPLLVPLLGSRSVVVGDIALADSLREAYPAARVRRVQTAVAGRATPGPRQRADPTTLIIGAPGGGPIEPIALAIERARAAGARVELIRDGSTEEIIARSDVIVVLPWPPSAAPLTPILAGMAAGKAVVTLELDATAEWPALDPQTWRPRGIVPLGTPIAVTLDPLDELHSLALTIRRLAADAELVEQLGRASHAWWQEHATPRRAAAAWNDVLAEAMSLGPPPRPAEWPPHLDADGTELARRILSDFKLTARHDAFSYGSHS